MQKRSRGGVRQQRRAGYSRPAGDNRGRAAPSSHLAIRNVGPVAEVRKSGWNDSCRQASKAKPRRTRILHRDPHTPERGGSVVAVHVSVASIWGHHETLQIKPLMDGCILARLRLATRRLDGATARQDRGALVDGDAVPAGDGFIAAGFPCGYACYRSVASDHRLVAC
jgi:hypothetical protein